MPVRCSDEGEKSASFFDGFKDFDHDQSAPPSVEFARLAAFRGWKDGSKRYRKMYILCAETEFTRTYGSDNKLATWQNLCHELDINDDIGSITKCKKALRTIHVNIIDLLDGRATGKKPRKFKNVSELRAYTCGTNRFFSLGRAKQDGLLKALLRPMY